MSDIVPRASTEEVEAREAFYAQEEIKTIIRRLRSGWIELAGHLYHFHRNRYWAKLKYSSVGEWLADPDIDIEWRQAYQMMQIYRVWVQQRGLEEEVRELPISALQIVSGPVEKGRVPPKEALADVESLSRIDLRRRYGGLGTIENHLEATEEAPFFTCSACGSRVRRRPDV